jgi:hypothetical protein
MTNTNTAEIAARIAALTAKISETNRAACLGRNLARVGAAAAKRTGVSK